MKKKILYIQPLHECGMNKLREKFDVLVAENANKDTILAMVPEVHALVTRLSMVDADIIHAGENLIAIAKNGVGVDNIDVAAATESGVCVLTTGNANSLSVAEHAFFALGALVKRIDYFNKQMQNKNWQSRDTDGSVDLFGKTIGVVGYGRIGSHLCSIAKNGFGMNVIVYDPYVSKEIVEEKGYVYTSDLDWLCREVDAITVHTPLSQETNNLIDARRLSLLRQGAYVINFARGGIINEEALYEALASKKLAGAALDAFSQEPPWGNCPFLQLDNVLLSPHCGTFSIDSRMRMSMQVAEGIEDALEGRIPKFGANLKEIFQK